MVRTHVYLTEEQKRGLERLAATTGKPQSDLFREALDQYLVEHEPKDWFAALERLFGMWAGRSDLDDFVPRLRRKADERLKRLWHPSRGDR